MKLNLLNAQPPEGSMSERRERMKDNNCYLSDSQRHKLLCKLADAALALMTDKQIVDHCPLDYGREVTNDHRTLVWDGAYEEFRALDDYTLICKTEQFLEPTGRAAELLNDVPLFLAGLKRSTGGPEGTGGLM